MSEHLARATLLMGQSRPELAEKELKLALTEDPSNAMAHSYLALCLAKQDRLDEAERESRQAVYLSPDSSFSHYAHASVLHDRNRKKDAEAAVREAIRLDHDDPNYFSLLAVILGDQARWEESLEAAECGLQMDPSHVQCLNFRALALLRLGREEEVQATFEDALAEDPEDPITHAHRGWALLHEGKYEKAMEHFREALRIDPRLDIARAGIVEALKARNPIYRGVLRYFLWASKFNQSAIVGVFVGIVVAHNYLDRLARSQPLWDFWLATLWIPVQTFGLLTYLADPMFNLVLRFDPLGKLALSDGQRRAAHYTALCFGCALVAAIGAWILETRWLIAGALVLLLLIPPLESMCTQRSLRMQSAMGKFVLLMCTIGAAQLFLPAIFLWFARKKLRILLVPLLPAMLLWNYQVFLWLMIAGCIFVGNVAQYLEHRERSNWP